MPAAQSLPPTSATAFARLSPLGARAVLSIVVVSGWLCVAITLSPWASGFADAPSRGTSDVHLYLAEAERIRAGEPYYDVVKTELAARGYPTRSVLNWRTPLPVWLVGMLPEGWGKALVVILAVAALLVTGHVVTCAAGLRRAMVVLVLMLGATLPAGLRDAYIMPEVWSGTLMALSLALYGIDRRMLAVACGIGALFFRELAAPYCLVCVLLALRERRWTELAAWVVGGAAYATFYVWHLTHVLPLIEADAVAHGEGWLQLGGIAFVISLAQMNVFLLLVPQPVAAVYLILALLGFAAARTDWEQRAAWSACAYVVVFGFVGHPFNQYWGSLIAPLLCLGAAQGGWALREIWQAARIPKSASWSSSDAI